MSDVYNPGRPFALRSSYGDRSDPQRSNVREFHAGVDYAAPAGTPIPSATSGVVVYSGRNSGFGNVVVVRNATGDYSLYAHMQDGDRAQVGKRVWPGDTIGQVGNTGERTTVPHLHYSILPASAGRTIENPALPHDGGPIGVAVNEANTIDPAKYDPQPYLDRSRRAAEILSGLNEKSPQNGDVPFVPKGRFDTPFSEATGDPLRAAPPANFADRFGTWASWPAGAFGNVGAPVSTPPKPGRRSDISDGVTSSSLIAEDDTAPARMLARINSPLTLASTEAPPLVPTAAQPSLGFFSGEPMRDYPVPPPIFQSKDQPPPEDNELYQRWMRWLDT